MNLISKLSGMQAETISDAIAPRTRPGPAAVAERNLDKVGGIFSQVEGSLTGEQPGVPRELWTQVDVNPVRGLWG